MVVGVRGSTCRAAARLESLERRTLFTASVLHEEVNDFGASEFADAVASDRNGRTYVLAHSQNDPAGDRLFVARYTEEGVLDTFFGVSGRIFGTFASFA